MSMNEKPEKASALIIFLMLFLLSFFYLMLGAAAAHGQAPPQKLSANQYIEMYKNDAIKEMKLNGVPASITLAQGMLESNNGNSELAVKANNHFGIKCHSDWQGSSFIMDDDTKNECFRKYDAVLDSYTDHSMFLKTRKRYAFLFEMNSIDYKAWAHGLKKAGYATDPRYAEKLIAIIESNNLAQYDNMVELPLYNGVSSTTPSKNIQTTQAPSFKVLHNNKRRYVTIKQGDTFYSISKHFKVEMYDLLKYNDCDDKYTLRTGSKIYIEPKKRKNTRTEEPTVKAGETMHSISQDYGIKLKSLYRINNIKKGSQVSAGKVLKLN